MKKLIPWLIFINVLLLPVWVILIATAPKCDGSGKQSICKNEPTSQATSAKVILPPTSNEVEAKINEWRVSQNLPAFNSDVPALDQAAQYRAEIMCQENDWSHAKDWQTLDKYYAYSWAGENLYYGTLREDQSADAVKTWVNSPTHLENLQRAYTQIGIGVKSCPGFQGDSKAVIITNYFGVPR